MGLGNREPTEGVCVYFYDFFLNYSVIFFNIQSCANVTNNPILEYFITPEESFVPLYLFILL